MAKQKKTVEKKEEVVVEEKKDERKTPESFLKMGVTKHVFVENDIVEVSFEDGTKTRMHVKSDEYKKFKKESSL